MKRPLLIALLFSSALSARADFAIDAAADPFVLSFRGATATTHFGWGSGSFDGATNDEVIDNPAPTLGTAPSGLALTQLTTGDILAGSNNVYNGAGPNSNPGTLQLIIPTAGTVGSGFTTIVIQGKASGGGQGGGALTTVPGFGPINGILPTFVWGANSAGELQWWVKYELPGNAATYNLQIALNGGIGIGPTSIANLQVDTLWSASGFAADRAFVTAPVPETVIPNTVPVLSVAGKAVRKTGARVSISGTTSDDRPVAGVFYTIDSGGRRAATGTENWTIQTRVAPGRHVLQVFAVDATGQLSVVRRVVLNRR